MLTVMREASEYCIQHLDEIHSIEDYFAYFIKEAHISLNNTPEKLEVLKKAGVVDSGGAGYNRIIEGMLAALDGKILANFESEEKANQQATINHSFNADSVLEFGYCTEFILQLQNSKVDIANFDINEITSFLQTIGNSIVAFKDEDIVKVHVHTFTPGEVISYCQKFGEYITFKMENMSVQHSELTTQAPKEEKEFKKYATVAVASGEGISDLFKQMGCDEIVLGGQTMNPSSKDFINAFEKLNAQHIICFPNNKNIIMAAKQASNIYDKAHVVVMESKSISQCYSALSMLDYSSDDINSIVDDFKMSMENVCDACITYVTRDCDINDFHIEKNDYMGFINHLLVCVHKNRLEAIKEMLSCVEDIEDKQVVITIMSGMGVVDDEIQQVIDYIQQTYPQIEVGHYDGKQDIYSFIFAIE